MNQSRSVLLNPTLPKSQIVETKTALSSNTNKLKKAEKCLKIGRKGGKMERK